MDLQHRKVTRSKEYPTIFYKGMCCIKGFLVLSLHPSLTNSGVVKKIFTSFQIVVYHTPLTTPPMSRILILIWNSRTVWATNLNERIPYFFTKFILISQIMKWKLPDNELLSQMLQIFNFKKWAKVSYLLSRSLGLHDPRSYWTSVLEVRNKCIPYVLLQEEIGVFRTWRTLRETRVCQGES